MRAPENIDGNRIERVTAYERHESLRVLKQCDDLPVETLPTLETLATLETPATLATLETLEPVKSMKTL